MSYRKKLIEVALPLEAINEQSVRESYIYKGNPSAVHKWWAQRPFAAARAVIFASLVDDPNDASAPQEFIAACQNLPRGKNATDHDSPRARLFDFIEKLVIWESSFDQELLSNARELINLSTDGNPPAVLDPFAGGGTIPFEAQRLGLDAFASDLNPVAVLINKALLEIPQHFQGYYPINPRDNRGTAQGILYSGAQGIASDIAYYGQLLRDNVYNSLQDLYPVGPNNEQVIAWLWARTVESPNPAVASHVPLISTYWLSSKKGKEIWLEPRVDRQTGNYSFFVSSGTPTNRNEISQGTKTGKRANFKCIISGEPITAEYIRTQGKSGNIGSKLLAIVTDSTQGRKFYPANAEHEALATAREPSWVPDFPLTDNPRHMSPPGYGMSSHSDLYTQRQLVTIAQLSNELASIRQQIIRDGNKAPNKIEDLEEYADAIVTYLAFAIDKHAMYGCAFVPWYAKESRPSMLFGRQAVSMVWDYTEVNPFSSIGGSFIRCVEIVADAVAGISNSGKGKVSQANAVQKVIASNVMVSTDPPYYDNVPYADLSDFFYIWLRYSLRDIYPDLFSTMLVPKSEELVADSQRQGGKEKAELHFVSGMELAFQNIRQHVLSDYPLSVYYAFKQGEADSDAYASTGWETMLDGLLKANFAITGTWPLRTERSGRLRDSGSNALASSIVLVCRPRPEDAPTTSRRAFLDDLRRELPAALKEMQSGNIAPVDLAQASIGPGMAIYSRYSKVLEADGSPMSVRTALGLINAALDEYLAEQDGDIDPDTRFAVDWFTQFGFNEGEFGQADVLARAKNTSVAGVESAGLVLSGRGKVKLKHWSEYDPGAWDPTQDKRPTVWEATHHLIERLNSHGETGSAMLMQKMPSDMAAEARQLAYRLYSICERKGWADHARDYNALVISWSGIGEEAARLRDAVARGDATTQMSMFGDDE